MAASGLAGSCGLAAVTWQGGDDWRRSIVEWIERRGLTAEERGTVRYWSPGQVRRIRPGLEMVDGCAVRRLALGRQDYALGFVPRRYYFEHGRGSPTSTPERQLFSKGDRPEGVAASAAHAAAIREARELAASAPASAGLLVRLEGPRSGLSASCTVTLGCGPARGGSEPFNALYKRLGFEAAPDNACLLVIPTGERSACVARTFADRLSQVFRSRGAEVDIRVTRNAPVRREPATGVQLLFDSKEHHDAAGLRLLDRLEALGFGVRRAYADDNFTYSTPEQAGSILAAIGGRPHSIRIGGVPEDLWYVGVDMCHRVDERLSILCVTLLDPRGKLVRAWKGRHPLDERVDRPLLKAALGKAIALVTAEDPTGRLLCLRDGRRLEGEDLYSESSERVPVTWVEVRKRGNPPLWYGSDYGLPPPDTWAGVPGSQVAFYVAEPAPRLGGWGHPIKLAWSAQDDPVGLGADGISRAIAGLRWAPSLGTKPIGLPAPLYWADGIAGASDSDLRFRGQPVELL